MDLLEYDAESDGLYVSVSSKSARFTVEISSRIGLDVSRDGRIVGVEILEASKVLSDLFQKKISREEIARILCTVSEKDAVYLNFEFGGQKASLALPSAYQSPALSV